MSSETPRPSPELVLSELALHERYARRIERIVTRVLGRDSEREDLVHETLIRVFTGIGRVRDPACLDQWVARVTLNTIRGTLRRRKRDRWTPLENVASAEEPAHSADVEAHEVASHAVGVIDRLPPPDRVLLVRHWFTDNTMAEIASTLGCSAVTVKRKLRRARARFHRLAMSDRVLSQDASASRVRRLQASACAKSSSRSSSASSPIATRTRSSVMPSSARSSAD
jgi:RNA polymerase sigma-70 factor (ECF subfamily)